MFNYIIAMLHLFKSTMKMLRMKVPGDYDLNFESVEKENFKIEVY